MLAVGGVGLFGDFPIVFLSSSLWETDRNRDLNTVLTLLHLERPKLLVLAVLSAKGLKSH